MDPLNIDHFSCTPLVHTHTDYTGYTDMCTYQQATSQSVRCSHGGCVLQMWACALGHQRAAELLYGWNSSALGIPDSLGRLPLAVARSRGHTRLAAALEELHTHMTCQDTPPPATPRPPPSPLSTSPDTGNAQDTPPTHRKHLRLSSHQLTGGLQAVT